jgi:RecA-family ATPase
MKSRVKNGLLSQTDRTNIDFVTNSNKFTSRLDVFKCTNGIRPNEFSVIVGPSGNGKSTLCKTISVECAIGGKTCYHILSEERSDVYMSTISSVFEKMCDGKSPDKYLERLFFESMLDWDEKERNVEHFFTNLEDVINDLCPDMVIFDNFTTSFMGELNINVQASMIARLRKMAAAYEIAIVGVFHTAKGTDIYKRILDGESVRGNASTTNAGAYNYVLSTYFRTKPARAIIHIDKARYHSEANKTYYEMLYDKELGIFVKDKKIEYNDIKKILDDANGVKKNANRGY